MTPHERKLVEANLRLVDWWLKRFVYPHAKLSYQDRQEARAACRMGLIYAARKHDRTRGKFSTYAVIRIRGEYFRWQAVTYRQRLRNRLEYRDPVEMEHKVIDPGKVEFPSMDAPEFWRDCARALTPRMTKILWGRFAEYKTLVQVGKDCGISMERVRQLEAQAICKLRERLPRRYKMEGG